MPRRYADYLPEDGFTTLNQVSTIGSCWAPRRPVLYNVWISRAARWSGSTTRGAGAGRWSGPPLPPPRHNFETIPRIRSESPAFDLHHPEVAAIELDQNEAERDGGPADAPDMEGREETVKGRTDNPEENA